jgi:hypothetical protein
LKEKIEKIASMKGKYENVVFVLVVFVTSLVAGKILVQWCDVFMCIEVQCLKTECLCNVNGNVMFL